jgi:hypothetical protein
MSGQTKTDPATIQDMWSIVNSGKLDPDQTAKAHEIIRKMFMEQQQKQIAKKNCELVKRNGSSCISRVLASDFIRDKHDEMRSVEGADSNNTTNSTRADHLNQRQQDRFHDTAGMLGEAAKARPCEIDTPYQK